MGIIGINENELSRVEMLVRVKSKKRKVVDVASLPKTKRSQIRTASQFCRQLTQQIKLQYA